MSEKPMHNEETLLRIISAIADEESSNEQKIRESLKEEGLDPDEVLQKWDANFRKKLAEYRSEKNKLGQGNKDISSQKKKPKGPKL